MFTKILGKYPWTIVLTLIVLLFIVPPMVYIWSLSLSTDPHPTITQALQEGLTTSTSPSATNPGAYTMTNTTYDSNGNIVVKTIDTSGNFSINTYGSTVVNQTASLPTAAPQVPINPNYVNPAQYQTQFLPPTTATTTYTNPGMYPNPGTTGTAPVVTANDISTIASAAISAAMSAYQSRNTSHPPVNTIVATAPPAPAPAAAPVAAASVPVYPGALHNQAVTGIIA
jgi:hypothetical protein